jgi:hypothetical protein
VVRRISEQPVAPHTAWSLRAQAKDNGSIGLHRRLANALPLVRRLDVINSCRRDCRHKKGRKDTNGDDTDKGKSARTAHYGVRLEKQALSLGPSCDYPHE